MDPIRPSALPPQSPAAAGADAARLAAQRAFFDIAMGKAAAPVVAAASPVQIQPQAAVQRVPNPAQPAPDRPLRPGSLLDIRV